MQDSAVLQFIILVGVPFIVFLAVKFKLTAGARNATNKH